MASLWDVRDEATAVLKKRFYEGMLRDGLSPVAALRAAQVSLWREKRWEAPYYWAGFVIQGEWNQSRALPLISRQSPRLVDSIFLARFARLVRYAGPTTGTRFSLGAA